MTENIIRCGFCCGDRPLAIGDDGSCIIITYPNILVTVKDGYTTVSVKINICPICGCEL